MDQDYADKLSADDKKWLSNFNEEWLAGNFQHSGRILHKRQADRRAIYTANNHRNNDLYGVTKVNSLLTMVPSFTHSHNMGMGGYINKSITEDTLIRILDGHDEEQRLKALAELAKKTLSSSRRGPRQ